MSRLLVLGLGGPDPAALVGTAAELGHEVHCATSGLRPPDDDPVWKDVTAHPLVDFADARIEETITEYVRTQGIDGVVTANEYLTPLTARVCARLRLPGNDPVLADAPRNKVLMAARFAAHGVGAPRTLVLDDREALLGVVPDDLPLPVVVKPAANAGSNGVSIVTDRSGLPEAFAVARAQGGETAPLGMALDRRILVQEYIGGEEYSVESVTQGGHSTHLCITRKITTSGAHRVETGHSLPAHLGPDTERRVLDETSRALAALGITDSVSHTEVKVTPEGRCRVIEAAARIGAGRIGVLVELALGISMPRASVDLALGNPVSVEPRRAAHAASRLFVAPSAGRLVDLHEMPEPGGDVHLVQVTRPIGSTVAGPRSNKGRVGHFVVHGADEARVNNRADELLARIRVVVEPADGTEADGGRA
ncbi:ATP-grasp domain-containing protein [Streptomyces sp. NPDC047072]|uniref:ATP-grasp domain-containing protein n=1 Tax=Streptomyces sp. NPDC047072 TaxID=3154809 RepID=UPI003402FABC